MRLYVYTARIGQADEDKQNSIEKTGEPYKTAVTGLQGQARTGHTG
jgi:hypothetical protein